MDFGEIGMGGCGVDSCGPVVGSCGHSNEPAVSIKGEEFF
jgi:hypothetical protein